MLDLPRQVNLTAALCCKHWGLLLLYCMTQSDLSRVKPPPLLSRAEHAGAVQVENDTTAHSSLPARVFRITMLMHKGASELTFNAGEEMGELTVEQYYRKRYDIKYTSCSHNCYKTSECIASITL